jgi:hypothetical protein
MLLGLAMFVGLIVLAIWVAGKLGIGLCSTGKVGA